MIKNKAFDFAIRVVVLIMVTGCSMSKAKENDPLSEIKEVKVSIALGLAKENPEILGTLKTDKSIKFFCDALKNAVEYTGEITLDNPKYNFIVINKDGSRQLYQFWDSWATGRIAEIKDGKITVFEPQNQSRPLVPFPDLRVC